MKKYRAIAKFRSRGGVIVGVDLGFI
jgi:hypothetical protein